MTNRAVFGAATGVGAISETGRLYGGIPPLNANEICFLVSIPVVVTFWRCVAEHARWFEYVGIDFFTENLIPYNFRDIRRFH